VAEKKERISQIPTTPMEEKCSCRGIDAREDMEGRAQGGANDKKWKQFEGRGIVI